MFGSSSLPDDAASSALPQKSPSPKAPPASPPTILPHGPCRFILLHPEIRERCSCQHFYLNRQVPGSSCECGHQACYHEEQQQSPSQQGAAAVVEQHSLDALLQRISSLEQQLATERFERLHARMQAVEESVDAAKTDADDFSKNLNRTVAGAYANLVAFQRQTTLRLTEVDDRLDGLLDRAGATEDVVEEMEHRVVQLDDAGMELEMRVEDVEAHLGFDHNDHEGDFSTAERPRKRVKSESSVPVPLPKKTVTTASSLAPLLNPITDDDDKKRQNSTHLRSKLPIKNDSSIPHGHLPPPASTSAPTSSPSPSVPTKPQEKSVFLVPALPTPRSPVLQSVSYTSTPSSSPSPSVPSHRHHHQHSLSSMLPTPSISPPTLKSIPATITPSPPLLPGPATPPIAVESDGPSRKRISSEKEPSSGPVTTACSAPMSSRVIKRAKLCRTASSGSSSSTGGGGCQGICETGERVASVPAASQTGVV